MPKIENIKVHKAETRGNKQRVLIEFDSDSTPTNGWLQFFTELFTEKPEVSGQSTMVQAPVVVPESPAPIVEAAPEPVTEVVGEF